MYRAFRALPLSRPRSRLEINSINVCVVLQNSRTRATNGIHRPMNKRRSKKKKKEKEEENRLKEENYRSVRSVNKST